MPNLKKIDLMNQNQDIDIVNIGWDDYSTIMVAIDTLIKVLENNIEDVILNQEREIILNKYKTLFEKLKQGYSPWRGQAISIEDNVLSNILNLK